MFMKQKIKKFTNKILDLIYPKNIKCIFCAEELNQNDYNCTCEKCLEILPFIEKHCERCGSPMNENQKGVCFKCKKHNYYFTKTRSVFEYGGLALKVVHNAKYNGAKYLLEHMAKYVAEVYSTMGVFPDFITYVPMFPSKEKARGYNQSKVLAEYLSERVDVPLIDCCIKAIDTKSQTELNTIERIENIKDSFKFNKEFKDKIKGKTIMIVDDVITTGATISEISRVLCENGVRECFGVSFAHTKLEQMDFEFKGN